MSPAGSGQLGDLEETTTVLIGQCSIICEMAELLHARPLPSEGDGVAPEPFKYVTSEGVRSSLSVC